MEWANFVSGLVLYIQTNSWFILTCLRLKPCTLRHLQNDAFCTLWTGQLTVVARPRWSKGREMIGWGRGGEERRKEKYGKKGGKVAPPIVISVKVVIYAIDHLTMAVIAAADAAGGVATDSCLSAWFLLTRPRSQFNCQLSLPHFDASPHLCTSPQIARSQSTLSCRW